MDAKHRRATHLGFSIDVLQIYFSMKIKKNGFLVIRNGRACSTLCSVYWDHVFVRVESKNEHIKKSCFVLGKGTHHFYFFVLLRCQRYFISSGQMRGPFIGEFKRLPNNPPPRHELDQFSCRFNTLSPIWPVFEAVKADVTGNKTGF